MATGRGPVVEVIVICLEISHVGVDNEVLTVAILPDWRKMAMTDDELMEAWKRGELLVTDLDAETRRRILEVLRIADTDPT